MCTAMIRHWSHARQKGWGYPPKKTACQSGLRFQRYNPLKSVTTAGGPAGRPLILRFLVYISRNSLRASRSLVIMRLFIFINKTLIIQTETERRRREAGVKQSMEIRVRSCMYVCMYACGWVGTYVWYLELSREPRHVAQQTRYQNVGHRNGHCLGTISSGCDF